MGYKCTFMDNDIYYAKDVNAMFANLTSAGVVLADSGNLLSDLNAAVSQVTSEGVQDFPDSCKLMLVDGVYKIGEGVCFMPDGSTITFDENGYEISPIADSVNYVYLKRNDTMNTIDVVVSDVAGGADSVPIAEIDEAGIIYDKRKYSRAKVRLNQEAQVRNFVCTIPGGILGGVVLDVERGDFSRLIFNKVSYNDGGVLRECYPLRHDIIKFNQDGDSGGFETSLAWNTVTQVHVGFVKMGSTLEITLGRDMTGIEYEIDFDLI